MQEKYSSYAFLIAKSILAKWNIQLEYSVFTKEFENHDSIYSIICQAPTNHLFNSLIVAQIKSYKQFIQKRMIDFFINNTSKAEDTEDVIPDIVSDLQDSFSMQQELLGMIEQKHYDGIAKTNAFLLQYIKKNIIKYGYLLNNGAPEIQAEIKGFVEEAECLKHELIHSRQTWRALAIRVSDTLMSVSAFQINELDDIEQRAELQFFDSLT